MAVRRRLIAYSEARDRHDARAMASFFGQHADLVGSTGQVSRGRVEIERTLEREHRSVYQSSRAIREIRSIRFLRNDVAIVDGAFEVVGAIDVVGRAIELKGLFTYVLTNDDGEWFIDAYRSMIPADVFRQ